MDYIKNKSSSLKQEQPQKKLDDVVIIRSLCIIVVVFFHAYHMMYVPVHFPKSLNIYHDIYYNFNSILLWFHMPIFIFMSGYLYCYLLNFKRRYDSFKKMTLIKIKRLIIPFGVFCLIFMITTNSFNWNNLLVGSWQHLWFITMLFNCFIFIRLINCIKGIDKPIIQTIILAISFAVMLQGEILPRVIGIQFLTQWFFWFYLGYVVFMHSDDWKRFIRKAKLIYALPLIYGAGMYYIIRHVGQLGEKTLISEISFLSMVVLIWYGVNCLIDRFGNKWTKASFFVEMSACSYGIYVFHYWLQPFMISRTAKNLWPLEYLAEEHVVIFPFVFALLSLVISYLITKVLLSLKVGRFLIG